MNFLNPAFLLALPLLGIPLAIHLLSRRQQKKIAWGAMRFLHQAATRRRRLWRLTDLLLLVLRSAAFLLIILALSRPNLPASWLGGAVPREVILILDTSLSLARRTDGPPLIEALHRAAQGLLNELSPQDSLRVLLAADSPHWLAPEPLPATPATLRQLADRIARLQPTLGGSDLPAALREATDLEAPKDKSARVLYLITDGQRTGWRWDERPLWESLQQRLAQAPIPTSLGLHWLDPGPPRGNLSVDRLETPRPFGAPDQPLTFTASVANHSTAPSAPTVLHWRIQGQPAGIATVPELDPGASTTLAVTLPFPDPGAFDLSCHLDASDALAPDNDAHLLVQIHQRLPILVVEDPASTEPFGNDLPFLLAALGAPSPTSPSSPEFPAPHSAFQPTILAPADLPNTDLQPFRVVILANLRSLPTSTASRLEDFAQAGGGIWLILGSLTDPEAFNATAFRGGLGLAPLQLSSPVGDPDDRDHFALVRAVSDTHPATALLADAQRLDLDRARVYRRHRFDPASGRDVSVLLQAGNGEPLVVERKLGRGRILVQGIPLGVSWSTLPLCQAFVPLVHEWLWYLTEPALTRLNLNVGETLLAPAPSPEAVALVTPPEGVPAEIRAEPSPVGPRFQFPGTRSPGDYLLTLQDAPAESPPVRFHLRRTPSESNLAPFNDADRLLLATLPWVKATTQLRGLVSSETAAPPRHPLDTWCLALLPLILLGEMSVAAWTSHRRTLRVAPVVLQA